MIKLQFSPGPVFLANYDQKIVKPTVRRMLEFLKKPFVSDKETFESLFSERAIKKLLLCDANALISYIHQIYGQLPILADRYWPAYLLAGCPIPTDIDSFAAKSTDDKAKIDRIYNETLFYLAQRSRPEYAFLNKLRTELTNASTHAKKRNALGVIRKASLGDVKLSKAHLSIFAPWINEFADIFNYGELSRLIGLDLVKECGIDICLYCNNENIQPRGKKVVYRPDLDHFHPKSKFPFLATTIANLVPSGTFCNTAYKKNRDMLDLAHPYILGVDKDPVFLINTPPGEKVTEHNYTVKLFSQGTKLDRSLAEFEIAHLYSNDREIKTWIEKAHACVEMHIGMNQGPIPEHILELLGDFKKPACAARTKKFKADSINQFANSTIIQFP